MDMILVALGTLALCYFIDKGFTKVFRGKVQHRSGLSVRLSKRYASIGLILVAVGTAAIFMGLNDTWILSAGGALLAITGICLITMYMTFGIFYDEDSFILTTFGKRSTTYRFNQIKAQQLYNAYGNIVIELHMGDGRTVQLQAGMEGVYPFLDKAFDGWLQQRGKKKEDCPYYDPENSCWFPPVED